MSGATVALMRGVRLCLSIAVLLLLSGAAQAKLCGGNVDGRAVSCACGDTVVSDAVLVDDPVVHSVCDGDGLIVRAGAATRGVTIDLHGRTLRGTGTGTGIWILNGGPGGARLVSTGRVARIVGFRDGIVAHGANSVALIEHIAAIRSRRDGMRVMASGYTIHAAAVADSGRDGFSVSGTGFEVTATRAMRSRRFGYSVMGGGGVIGAPGAGNKSLGSGLAAISLTGVWHRLIECQAAGAAQEGVHLNGMHLMVSGCVAQGNGGDGITGTGGDVLLSNNQAVNNGNNGIIVHGTRIVDGGGNRGTGNSGKREPRPPTQCEIADAACAP